MILHYSFVVRRGYHQMADKLYIYRLYIDIYYQPHDESTTKRSENVNII